MPLLETSFISASHWQGTGYEALPRESRQDRNFPGGAWELASLSCRVRAEVRSDLFAGNSDIVRIMMRC